MNFFKKRLLSVLAATLFILPVMMISGCKDLSNDSPENTSSLVVNLGDLQKQMGISSSSNSSSSRSRGVDTPVDSPASNEVKSLLVGAFVVNSRSEPYSLDVAITEEVEEDVQDDLAASVDYIEIVTLPTDNDYVEFSYPKSDLSRWQVIAVALDFEIKEFAELGEDAHEESVLYMGFNDRFYTASTIENVSQVPIEMSRACLLNAVKGCATYGDSVDESPVVTSAVEILDVRYETNGQTTVHNSGTVTFPLIVTDETSADSAAESLKTVRDEIVAVVGAANIESLTVRTTHTGSAAESEACQNLYGNSPSLSQLDTNCEKQFSKISY